MADLCFKGPFHFNHLTNSKNPNSLNLLNLNGKSGIYIWGFMDNMENNHLIDPINFSKGDNKIPDFKTEGVEMPINWKFIPYYVGLKNGGIDSRLNEHHLITKGDGLKKTRMTMDFYKQFYLDTSGFPINIGDEYVRLKKLQLLVCSNPNSVDYFNNLCILKSIHKNLKINIPLSNLNLTDIPISSCCINKKQIDDTLDSIINTNNNFWFCYAELPVGVKADKYMEAQTFYSLKGKTISETLPINPCGFGYTIKDKTNCDDIFKHKITGGIHFEDDFKGYLDNSLY